MVVSSITAIALLKQMSAASPIPISCSIMHAIGVVKLIRLSIKLSIRHLHLSGTEEVLERGGGMMARIWYRACRCRGCRIWHGGEGEVHELATTRSVRSLGLEPEGGGIQESAAS